MFKFFQETGWFIKKHWFLYFAVITLGVALSLLLLIPTEIIGDFVDILKNDNRVLTGEYLMFKIVSGYLITTLVIYITVALKRILQIKLSIAFYYDLQVKYLEKILSQDAVFFEQFQSGDLLIRALGDVRAVRMSGVNRIINIFVEVMSIIIVLVRICLIDWQLTLLCIIPFPAIFLFNFFFKKVIKKNWRKVRKASSEMGNVVLESITNIRTIRAFSKEKENCDKIIQSSEKVYQIEKRNLKINSAFDPIFQTIVAISTILLFWFGSEKIIYGKGSFDTKALVMMALYLRSFASPLTRIGNMINNFYESLISLERLNDVYHSKSLVVDLPEAKELPEVKSIAFQDVSFRYMGDDDYSLKNISFTLRENQTLGIVGKTGSGKSTLVRQLIRQFPLEQGDILINGISIQEWQKESIREHVGYVPQEHTLFSRTVEENVRLGSTHPVEEEVLQEAILMADFNKDIPYLPFGLDTVVGEYGVTLSGGQKQRLAIARAFLKDADILILDDSLSAVDGKTEANIIGNLKKYRQNKMNIIVTHRLTAVMQADYILVLQEGKIVEQGTHQELMNLRGWYWEQFEEQLMKEGDTHEA